MESFAHVHAQAWSQQEEGRVPVRCKRTHEVGGAVQGALKRVCGEQQRRSCAVLEQHAYEFPPERSLRCARKRRRRPWQSYGAVAVVRVRSPDWSEKVQDDMEMSEEDEELVPPAETGGVYAAINRVLREAAFSRMRRERAWF